MTIKEIVKMFKEEKPNKVSDAHIVQWLNECEAEVQEMLKIPNDEWEVYTTGTLNTSTEPIAKSPYDKLYLYFLMARLDYANQGFESYANNQANYTAKFNEYKRYAIRNSLVANELPEKVTGMW